MALAIEGATLDGEPCNLRIEDGTIAALGAEVAPEPDDERSTVAGRRSCPASSTDIPTRR